MFFLDVGILFRWGHLFWVLSIVADPECNVQFLVCVCEVSFLIFVFLCFIVLVMEATSRGVGLGCAGALLTLGGRS